ncbi:DNA cross-link repair 1A protein-like isoform X2 [Contarinia nasturtii]|uniref:DNA cross-link repair 1A protein-like isoform X2 n=1 Tax=Contarinia nasturtii TaxID=265458 RepID=UPI0012D45888|nr:DNA cross-link repair 1A protein-like isoform X2 [Contarinia nasturtii]
MIKILDSTKSNVSENKNIKKKLKSIKRGRPFPSHHKYHKIDEYFHSNFKVTKKDFEEDKQSTNILLEKRSNVGKQEDLKLQKQSIFPKEIQTKTIVSTTANQNQPKELNENIDAFDKTDCIPNDAENYMINYSLSTKFAVDAFRYGDIDGVDCYFLSHFHADHYIGLKKSFNHKLYLSNISGRLVMEFIKVDKQYIRCLDISIPVFVDEVEVTALDANHCPGAVMFLFKFKTGKCILHTGDMRASPTMEEYPEFWNNQIETIYLDTTYLSSKFDFPTQAESIDESIGYCEEFINSSSSGTHLIVCGAYKIGKEKVWLRLAQEFNYKVWIDADRHRAMKCIQNDEISSVLTDFITDAQIHVLPISKINYQFLVKYVDELQETFSKVLAIRPRYDHIS